MARQGTSFLRHRNYLSTEGYTWNNSKEEDEVAEGRGPALQRNHTNSFTQENITNTIAEFEPLEDPQLKWMIKWQDQGLLF